MPQGEINITVDNLTPLMKGLELDTGDEDVKDVILEALLDCAYNSSSSTSSSSPYHRQRQLLYSANFFIKKTKRMITCLTVSVHEETSVLTSVRLIVYTHKTCDTTLTSIQNTKNNNNSKKNASAEKGCLLLDSDQYSVIRWFDAVC